MSFPTVTLDQLNTTTRAYYLLDGGKEAWNNFFTESAILPLFLNNPEGLTQRIPSGAHFQLPILIDQQKGGSFRKGVALDASAVETKTSAYFLPKFNYGNGTLFYEDIKKNAGGDTQIVNLIQSTIKEAQMRIQQVLWDQIFENAGAAAAELDGLGALFDTNTATAYGQLTEADYPTWKAVVNTDSAVITDEVLRTLRSEGKVGNGMMDRPNYCFTTEALYNKLIGDATALQRFTNVNSGSTVADLGFEAFVTDTMKVFADDNVEASQAWLLNTKHVGMGILGETFDVSRGWIDMEKTPGKNFQIYAAMNLICSRRAAHVKATALTVS